MTRLVLVRHGESNVTVQQVAGGMRACTGLTELGRAQAEALRERWQRHPELTADAVVASDLPRARETAELVLPALGDLPLELDPGLREMDPGPELDGAPWERIVELVGSTEWETDPYHLGFPGGETVAGFQHRTAGALAALVRRHQGKVVVAFCHGGVVDVAMRVCLRTPFVGGFELHTRNTSITEIEQRSSRWRLLRYNDAAHLAGLPQATPRS